MQVTDLLLRDGGQGVDRVEPSVELLMLCQLLEAGILEVGWVLNSIDLFDELSSLRRDRLIVIAVVEDVLVEVVQQ